MKSPTPAEIKQAREKIQAALGLGITEAQKYCAELIYAGHRTWQHWEKGDREMHQAFFELFKIKAGL
jgi:DNA-binding transcriptional regulator YiaG